MILVQAVLAGTNIFYKLALNDGMDAKILIAYRHMLAAVFLCPIAFFFERKKRPKLTWKVLMQAFCCGLFGGSLGQNLYVASVQMTSATFATAMTNLMPAVTFILAVLFRLENLGIGTAAGHAKIAGTIVALGGAMILTFYKGPEINIWPTSINLLTRSHHKGMVPQENSNLIAGLVLAISGCVSVSIWMIIQAKMTNAYPCFYSTTALMSLMGSFQSVIAALCFNKDFSQWKLGFDIRLFTVSYSGAVASGLIFTVMAWCIQQRGPLYASVFSPIMLVIVAILGSLLINEKLHTGSIIGTVLIITGLYMMLWGKKKEAARVENLASESVKEPSEPIGEPLEVVLVDGLTISRNASFARNGSLSDVKMKKPGIACR